MDDELKPYRMELKTAVNVTQLKKYCRKDRTMPEDPMTWEGWDALRAIGFGLISKWDTQLLAIEALPSEEDESATT